MFSGARAARWKSRTSSFVPTRTPREAKHLRAASGLLSDTGKLRRVRKGGEILERNTYKLFTILDISCHSLLLCSRGDVEDESESMNKSRILTYFGHLSERRRRLPILARCWQPLNGWIQSCWISKGSFSAVTNPFFASTDSFCSVCQVLQDLRSFASLPTKLKS